MAEKFLGNVRGSDGKPASISIGSVKTVEADQPAKVSNSGTSANVVLDFEIPKGRPGLPGADGQPGSPGQDGESIRGPSGRAATLKINSIEMLPEGSEPEVESLGNETDAEYVLKIPFGSGTPPEDAFIENSENPVQSKVIQEALAEKADASSVPTKVSDLENDSSFISSSAVEGMIQDAVDGVVSATNPVDDALSDVSENAVQNAVITEEFGKKVEMSVSDLNDENETKIGETVTLRDANRELSIDLRGQEAIAATLTTTIAGRQPIIVATLPATGDETILYLVPVEGNNYSMHIWMDVAGTMQYVSVSGGDGNSEVDKYKYVGLTNSSTITDGSGRTLDDIVRFPGSQWAVDMYSYDGVLIGGKISCSDLSWFNFTSGNTYSLIEIKDLSYFGVTKTKYERANSAFFMVYKQNYVTEIGVMYVQGNGGRLRFDLTTVPANHTDGWFFNMLI